MLKLLDCTLRDGGYYTNWDFDQNLIVDYAKSMEELPIDYIEVGYRSIPLKGYLGKYFYCPIYVLKQLKSLMPSKKLVVILNEKDTRPEHLEQLLAPIKPYITLVRIAVDPKNFERAVDLAKAVKAMSFEVAFNVMYMSNWKKDPSFLELLKGLDETLDYFYMVDSFGGVLPNEVRELTQLVKSKTNVSIGFHSHDNLSMGLINTITALEHGCDIVDATITGMGRGAGNLKTELLLTYLESQNKIELNFNSLVRVVLEFEELRKIHGWGTSLPYMFSGSHSLPQKDVMDWVSKRTYSLNSIIQALFNKKENIDDNICKISKFIPDSLKRQAVIIGGGPNAKIHSEAVKEFVNLRNENTCIIHSSSKNAIYFKNIDVKQYFCLVGNEGYRLNRVFNENLKDIVHKCILPSFPRRMGTYIPNQVKNRTYELDRLNFSDDYRDSHFAIALQTCIQLGCKDVFLVGFDGYNNNISNNEIELADENNYLIEKFKDTDINLISLTETKYNINVKSIYEFLK